MAGISSAPPPPPTISEDKAVSVKDKLTYALGCIALIYIGIALTCYKQSYQVSTAYSIGELRQKRCYPAYLVSETGDYEARQKMSDAAATILKMRNMSVFVNTCASLTFVVLFIIIRFGQYNNDVLMSAVAEFAKEKNYYIRPILMALVVLCMLIVPTSLALSENKSYAPNISADNIITYTLIVCCILAYLIAKITDRASYVILFMMSIVVIGTVIVPLGFVLNGTTATMHTLGLDNIVPYTSILGCVLVYVIAKLASSTDTSAAPGFLAGDYETSAMWMIAVIVLFTILIGVLNRLFHKLKSAMTTYDEHADALQTNLDTYKLSDADIVGYPADSELMQQRELVLRYIGMNVNDVKQQTYSADALPNDPYRTTDTWKYIANGDGLELVTIFPETALDPTIPYVNPNIGYKSPDGFTTYATLLATDVVKKISTADVQTGFVPLFVYQGTRASAIIPTGTTTVAAADFMMVYYINLVYGSKSTQSTNNATTIGLSNSYTHIRVNDYIFQLHTTDGTTKGFLVKIPDPDPAAAAPTGSMYKNINAVIEAAQIDLGNWDSTTTGIGGIIPHITSCTYVISSTTLSYTISNLLASTTSKMYIVLKTNTKQYAYLVTRQSDTVTIPTMTAPEVAMSYVFLVDTFVPSIVDGAQADFNTFNNTTKPSVILSTTTITITTVN